MSFDSIIDILLAVYGGYEHSFELRWRNTDALIEHLGEVAAEHIQVTGFGRFEVDYLLFGKERANHGAHTVNRQRNTWPRRYSA